MQWYNEPANWTTDGTTITVVTDPQTDFWQKTHYGFIRDNGHFYFQEVGGDFVVDVHVKGMYTNLYDQAGLMLRADERTWMKCGIEFVDGVQHASVVVTRDYSDWSVVPLGSALASIWLRVRRNAGSVEVLYALDGEQYRMLRVAHLAATDSLQVGVMAASPEGDGFSVTFDSFSVRNSDAGARPEHTSTSS